MAPRGSVTREIIIGAAQELVARKGTDGLTFQALADVLGVSKQAVLYWYPGKWELVQDLAVTALRDEAEATIRAIAGAGTAREAIARFLRTLVDHHLADLGRFRVLYLGPQLERRPELSASGPNLLGPIHETTATMYAALAAVIAADHGFARRGNPRRLAVAVHMAGIGALTMLSLADAVGDPLAHDTGALVDAMVALLTGAPDAAATGVDAGH